MKNLFRADSEEERNNINVKFHIAQLVCQSAIIVVNMVFLFLNGNYNGDSVPNVQNFNSTY